MPTDDDCLGTVTRLLRQWHRGDRTAADRLFSVVYGKLRDMARAQMSREHSRQVLQPTALVHEIFLKLAKQDGTHVMFKSRTHFFAVASRAMGQVLIDVARARDAEKRGDGIPTSSLDDHGVSVMPSNNFEELVLLGLALQKLKAIDQEQSALFEYHVFGGLSHREIAEHLNMLESKVQNEVKAARAWLRRELRGGPDDT